MKLKEIKTRLIDN